MIENDYIYPNVKNYLYKIPKISGFDPHNNTHLFFNPLTHYWISVDDIGAEIISALESTKSYKGTGDLLKNKYNIDDATVESDVKPFVENLIRYKFYTHERNDSEAWWYNKDTSSVVKKQHPFNEMYISLTNDCNLRCIYCFNYEKRKENSCCKKDITDEQLKTAIKQFKDLGGESVVFTGGEPTLNKSLISLAEYAREIGLSPKMITNGTLLDRIDVEELCSVIKDITVSLDSVNVNELDQLWGVSSRGALESVVRGLKRIDKYSESETINLIIAPIVSAVNMNELNNIVSFARNELTHCNIEWNFTKYGKVNKEEVDVKLDITEEMMSAALQDAFDLHEAENNQKCFYVASECGKRVPHSGPHFAVCAPSFFITANGDIYPCQRLDKPEYLLGNITEISLSEAVENENFKKLYENISPNSKERCKNCELRFVCTFKGGICADFEEDKRGDCHNKMLRLMFMQTMVSAKEKKTDDKQH